MQESRLQHFPVSFFSVIMGMSGFTIATQKIEAMWSRPHTASTLLLGLTLLLFGVILAAYLAKVCRYPLAARAELMHPVRLSFLPTMSISLLLLAIAALEVAPGLSRWLWWVGAPLHLVFTLTVLSMWIRQTHFQITHMNPAWFIPVVGNMLVPIAGMRHAHPEVSWFFFSIGLVFWVVLFSIFMYRIIFHTPLQERLLPTLFILIAPPAVGCIAYVKLTGAVDPFARVLYFFALFLCLLLFMQAGLFRTLRFYLSWWAYSFPLAALSIASFLMFAQTGYPALCAIAVGVWCILAVLICILCIRTLHAIRRRDICVEE